MHGGIDWSQDDIVCLHAARWLRRGELHHRAVADQGHHGGGEKLGTKNIFIGGDTLTSDWKVAEKSIRVLIASIGTVFVGLNAKAVVKTWRRTKRNFDGYSC